MEERFCLKSGTQKALVFDTETSGLKSGYNVILQLSYQIVDVTDWTIIKNANHYFEYPKEAYRVEQKAIELNGLTREFLSSQSLSNKKEALTEFICDLNGCDVVVAHNFSFDSGFIVEECIDEGVISSANNMSWPERVDTMMDTTDFCQLLPIRYGEYKWPKLSELADKLGIGYKDLNLHDSRSDVELTKRCFKELCAIGFYKKKLSFIEDLTEELDFIEDSIKAYRNCITVFRSQNPGIVNKKDVLSKSSEKASSYLREKEGCYEMKFTLQAMSDFVAVEEEYLKTYVPGNISASNPNTVVDTCASCLDLLERCIVCIQDIVNVEKHKTIGRSPSDGASIFCAVSLANYLQYRSILPQKRRKFQVGWNFSLNLLEI